MNAADFAVPPISGGFRPAVFQPRPVSPAIGHKVVRATRALACALLTSTASAHAVLKSDPFVYDPAFNGGVVIEDRFAATSVNTSDLGLRLVVGAGGDLVTSGIVGPAFQATSPPGNLGLVRYGPAGERLAWGNPTSQYSYFYDIYVDYPNILGAAIGWVRDLKMFNGYLYALVDLNLGTGSRDVRVFTFTDGDGAFVADTPAFTTGLDESGAALIPYCHHELTVGGVPLLNCNLIAVATYATAGGRQIVTMKSWSIGFSDGSLSINNTFGISNNGAMDQPAPDALCTDHTGCSWSVAAATAVRTADDHNPTLYLAGTMKTSAAENDSLVIAVNGIDGSLATSFGGGSGYYVNYEANSSGATAIVATTTGDATTDMVYLATNTFDGCGQKSVVTKLRANVLLIGGGTVTLPDFNWGDGGNRDVGGNPNGCANVYTYAEDMILDGDRLVLTGYENLTAIPDPLFAIVRASDGALTEFARAGFTALHADGSPWGGAAFRNVVARGGGRYAVTGYLYDASASYATLFGTASLVSDRIFGDDFGG